MSVRFSFLLVCRVQMSRWLLEEKAHVTMQEQLRIVSECRERLEVEAAGFRLDLARECLRMADLQALARCAGLLRTVLSGSSGESLVAARGADATHFGSCGSWACLGCA